MGAKIILTEKQEKWLKKHYKNTKNDEIVTKLGISATSVHRFARLFGLKKSQQFMRKCQRATTEAAKQSHIRNGTYPPKGYRIPKSELYYFKAGKTPIQRIGAKREAERIRKSAESRKRTYQLERARAIWGLEQHTKLRVITQPRAKVCLRYYLKKRGYIVDDVARVAYYTEETKRGKTVERRPQLWYKFLPLDVVNQSPKNGQNVNRTKVDSDNCCIGNEVN